MAEQFSTTRSLSGSAPRITRAVSATAPVPTAPTPAPEDESSVATAAKSIGSSALSGLSMLGNLLDLPGSMIRDVLVADNPFDQLLDPLSHQSTGRSVDGREMLSRNLLTGLLFSPNKETGISGWASDPMEGVQDIAGFAAELALDPLSWLTGGVAKAPGMFGDLAKAVSAPARAGKLGKLDKGLQIINELDPGTHVGRALGIPQALAKRSRAAHAAKMFEQTAGPERERVYSELKNTVGQEQADAVIRTGAARAATWANEAEGRTPDEFFKKVRVQKSDPGQIGSGALNQGPSAPDTPEFKNWFGDYIADPSSASKVVGQDGRPLVVYHGTGTPDLGTAAAKENNINLAKNREEWAKYKSAEKDAGPARKAALKNEETVRGQFASAVSDIVSKKNAHLPFSSSDYDFTSRESLAKSIYKAATYPEREAMWNKGTFREIDGVVTTSIDDSTFSKLQKAHQEWMNAEAQRKSINPRPKSEERSLSSFQNEDPVFQTMRYGANDPGYYAAGSHFTDNADKASRYATDQKVGNPGVIPAYLNMRKPYILGETKDPQVEQFINDAVDARRRIAQVKRKGDLDELARAFAVGRTEGLQKAGYDGMVVKTKAGTEYIVFKPEQIKSVNNKGSFDSNNPSILHQSATKGASDPGQVGKGALNQGENTSAPTFYSKIIDAIDAGKVPNRVDRTQLEKTLVGYGVKQEELADLKPHLDELFTKSDGKVSSGSLFDMVLDKSLNQLNVTELSDSAHKARFARGGKHFNARYIEHTVAGGIEGTERELLFGHPSATPFGGGHYGDFPDTFAHARLDDVVLPDGSKSLRINEIQSDLHQQGSKEGYKGAFEPKLVDPIYEIIPESFFSSGKIGYQNAEDLIHDVKRGGGAALDAMDELHGAGLTSEQVDDVLQIIADSSYSSVPDAPFKKSWHELALKQIIRTAAEEGYSSISLVKGADIADAVGGPPEALGKFYDEKLTNTLSKMVKKSGGTVEKIRLPDLPANLVMTGSTMNKRGDILKNGIFSSPNYKDIEVRVRYSPDADMNDSWSVSIRDKDGNELLSKSRMKSPDDASAWAEKNIPELQSRGKEMTVFNLPEKFRNEVLQKGQPLYQTPSATAGPRGAIEFAKDNDAIIHIFENGDVSTAIHEFFHYFRRELPENLLNAAADSIGVKSGKWDRTSEEAFASMGERYALEGKAPTPALRAVFEKFKEWMTNIYSSLDGTPLDQNIHPNLRQVFDDMLGGKAAAENMPTTMADRAFEALDGYASIFQAKAKSAVQSAYESAPQSVKSTADFIRTEAGQKVDALTRWTMSAFNNRVDNRMTETGQQSAKVMTAIQDDLTRKFSEPVIQTLSDIAHYGPDGTADIKAALREGQTIEDWHSEFSDALMYAMEKGDTEPLARLAPEGLPADAPNPFVESYTRLRSHGDRILHEQRAAGVDIGDLTDVIDHMFRQMNPRLADWRAARELMPNAGEGTGTVTREDLFRGFYSGTGGKVASGVNRITADPDVLAAVRRSAAAKDPGPSAAGEAVAKVIESKYAGDVDPRMPVVTSSGRFQFRDPSKEIPATPAAPPVAPSSPPSSAFTGDQQKIDELLSQFEKIFVDSTGKPSERIVRDQVIGGGFDPDMVDAVMAARKSAPPTPAPPTAPAAPAITKAAKPAPLFDLSKSELSSYYRRVPEAAEREFSTAAGDAFDLPINTPFDMQNPVHRAEVFRSRTPIKYEKIAGDPDDHRFAELPDIIHQEFSDRWKELGRYLWGSDDATRVQQMVDHTNAVEANGGVFGRHALLNQQRYNQMAAKRIATARHFTDVFEGGLRTGQIRNPDALTPQALSQTVGRNIERSAGVKLGDIFDSLEGSYDRDRIYQNSYERLAAADPQTFDAFMKQAELPEGLDDIADELGDLDMPKELDMDAFRAHMDNLVVDQELAQELKGLHRASETQSPGIKSLKTLAATLSAQWKAGVLSFPSTQVRNYTSGAIANMYSGIWSGLSHAAGEDVLFNRPNDLLQELPEIVAYMKKRGLDPSDPMSPTRAAREMYAIEKGHLASESRDFVGQANSADDMTDINHMFGLLPGHRNIRSRKELGTEYLATLAGKREASWRDPFDIAGTTRVFGPNKGTTRAESNFAPVSAINIWGKASDDANRLAGWVEGMRQGKSSREAFRRVDQVQLNYDPSKFTDVERKLKVIFPFYSFFSRQTAYFAKELMTNPAGKLGKLIRLMNSSQTDEYLPEHVREGGAIPFGKSEDGTENYITNFGLMFEDVPKTLIPDSSDDLARNLLSKTNPLIKAPVEYALGRSSFQGGPMGGRDINTMDPLLGRILTQLGVQEALPNQNARPAFGSPMLEHALANSPLSRLLSTTKTLVDSPERKSILDKAIITLTGMRITSVSPEQRQRGIRELTNKLSQDLGARAFETYHISQALLDDAKANDPEKYQKLMEIKKLRAHWDKVQRIKRKEQAKEMAN